MVNIIFIFVPSKNGGTLSCLRLCKRQHPRRRSNKSAKSCVRDKKSAQTASAHSRYRAATSYRIRSSDRTSFSSRTTPRKARKSQIKAARGKTTATLTVLR